MTSLHRARYYDLLHSSSHLTRSLMLSGTPRGMEREGAIEKCSRVCVCVNE